METLEHLQRQLHSITELRTLVKTMKALSAANIHQYEQAVAALAGYYLTVERGLYVVLKQMYDTAASAQRKKTPRRFAAIVFGSDHGLCGRFNEQVSEFACRQIAEREARNQGCDLIAVGSRVAANLEHEGHAVEQEFLVPAAATQITLTVQQLLLEVDRWREGSGERDVHLIFNRRRQGQDYHPVNFHLLPINLNHFHQMQERFWPSRRLPAFSMDREVLLSRLLHQYLFVSIFRACAESQACEHASRMAAMQSAQRNLDDRYDEVTRAYRHARQSAITAELLDVVTGFEAIAGTNAD